MKKLLYSCIAFCTLVLAGCADQDVAETNATNNDGPGVKVSMTMEGEMQSDAAAATPNSRAIGYEVKDTKVSQPLKVFTMVLEQVHTSLLQVQRFLLYLYLKVTMQASL